jgi:YD repeat-containing protein
MRHRAFSSMSIISNLQVQPRLRRLPISGLNAARKLASPGQAWPIHGLATWIRKPLTRCQEREPRRQSEAKLPGTRTVWRQAPLRILAPKKRRSGFSIAYYPSEIQKPKKKRQISNGAVAPGRRRHLGYQGRPATRTPDPSLTDTPESFTYTSTGKRASMTDASGTTTYTYDNLDHLITKATPQGTLNYTYDAAGNVASMASSNAKRGFGGVYPR